jgi:alanine or glycine:cation symporter, AGCS family
MQLCFQYIENFNNFYWMYLGWIVLFASGIYLTVYSRFYQFKVIWRLFPTMKAILLASEKDMPGISPIRLFFASVGGTIGIGNIAAVTTAILIGGPGALFWLWLAAGAGMIIKYTDVYLAIRYRVANAHNGYDGGPMYYIPKAIKGKIGLMLAYTSASLLCIYGIEIYQFTVIVDTFDSLNLGLSREWVIILFLSFTFYIVVGGVKRLANFCAWIMPIFLCSYVFLCLWVVLANFEIFPSVLAMVFKSAFTGQSATGGFAGSTLLLAAQQGAAQGVYSSDTAIGFDAVVQSESNVSDPHYQATLAIISTFTDAFICTMTAFALLANGIWQSSAGLYPSQYVAECFKLYFAHTDYIFVIVIFLAGFTTIQGYFVVGAKAAHFISKKWGKTLYFIYGFSAYWLFSHYSQQNVLLMMNLSSGFLVLINLIAILILSRNLKFEEQLGVKK